jgi:hypothetical protein
VWAWPFPEVCTAAEAVGTTGSSDCKMGTAPHVWNVLLGGMAQVIPRAWWRNEAFSRFLADFSEPLVHFADRFVGETHGMRVDVRDTLGNSASAVQVRGQRGCHKKDCTSSHSDQSALLRVMRRERVS